MADSVRELIEQNVKTTLEGVTIANGYQVNILQVFRYGQPFPATPECPAAQIIPEGETYEPAPHPLYTAKLTLMVALLVEAEVGKVAKAINDILADVTKALMADVTRGGNAVRTFILSSSVYESGVTEPIGDVRLRVEIHYRMSFSNPYAGVN